MALTMQQKKQIVADVHHEAKNGLSLVAAFYATLTVADMTLLRVKARQAGVFVKVIKNSLAKRAFEGTPFQTASEHLKGQLVYFIAKEAPGMAARLVRDFAKDHDALTIKVLSVGETLYDVSQLDAVANLPTKEEALAKLMAALNAPVSTFVRTLGAPHSKLVRTLSAIKETK